MTIILSLGVSNDILEGLSKCLKATVHAADQFDEALTLLEDLEVNTILCDAHNFPIDLPSVERLLGCTPPTTRIVLLASDAAAAYQEQLANLGVTTLLAPVAAHELARALTR